MKEICLLLSGKFLTIYDANIGDKAALVSPVLRANNGTCQVYWRPLLVFLQSTKPIHIHGPEQIVAKHI